MPVRWIALAIKFDPAGLDLIVHNDQFRSLRDFFVVTGFAELAVLSELEKRAAHADAVFGQVACDWRVSIHGGKLAGLLCRQDCAVIFPLLLEDVSGSAYCFCGRFHVRSY